MAGEGIGDGEARLYGLARALAGSLTAGEVAQALFEHAVSLGAETVGLWVQEGSVIRLLARSGYTGDLPSFVTYIPMGADMPAAQVIRTGRSIAYRSSAERDAAWPNLAGVGTSPSVVILPLTVGDRTYGCLHFGFGGPVGPSVERPDEADLQPWAELTAAALDRARLSDAERERQAVVLEASTAVATAQGFEEALRRLAETAVPRLADLCVIVAVEDSGDVRRLLAVHADPDARPLLDRLMELQPAEGHPASRAIAERRTFWQNEISDDQLQTIVGSPAHMDIVRELGYDAFVVVPLVAVSRVLGAMALVSSRSGRRFGPADVAVAEDLAARVSGVVSAAQQAEREHQLAHELQRLLLPEALPDTPGLETAARYLTARSDAEAGGDFYDVLRLPSGRIGFAIGDVEGHDPVAAAVMGQLRAAIRALAGQYREPEQVLDALRWSWDLLGFSRMATCQLGRLDPASGELWITSAGHLPPIIVDSSGARLLELPVRPPLGAPSDPSVVTTTVLEPGQTLFLYTDGLVDSGRGDLGESIARLADSLGEVADLPLPEMCRLMASDGPTGTDRPDDIAVLAVRRVAAVLPA